MPKITLTKQQQKAYDTLKAIAKKKNGKSHIIMKTVIKQSKTSAGTCSRLIYVLGFDSWKQVVADVNRKAKRGK